MPRISRKLRLVSIDSVKHVVDIQGGLSTASTVVNTLADTVDSPALGVANAVRNPCHIKAIHLNVQVAATGSAALNNIYLILVKNVGANLTFPAPNAVGVSDNKKFVFFQNMVMAERSTAGNPRVLVNEWIAVPKRYQRMGANDRLEVHLRAQGQPNDFCIQAIYKEYR